MRHAGSILFFLVSVFLFNFNTRAQTPSTQPVSNNNFVFCYFLGNGEDGLHLASSHDGLNWTPLNNGKSFLAPGVGGGLMRDPCIAVGPDGTFRMVWTAGWYERGIGYASSSDLIHWSTPQYLEVMKSEPTAVNAWAPEVFYDDENHIWMIYWSSTIPGRFPETDASGDVATIGQDKIPLNHRIYFQTTPDFKTFSDTKLLYDDHFSEIDATIAKVNNKYVMVLKDETLKPTAKKNLRIATAEHIQGPWSPASEPFTMNWVEGPTTLKIGDTWFVYFDKYRSHKYGGMTTTDWKTWKDITNELRVPSGIRHGTAIPVPAPIFAGLEALSTKEP